MAVTADVLQAEIRARDRASKGIERVSNRFGGLAKAVKRVGVVAAGAATGALAGLVAASIKATKMAADQRTGNEQLALALERSGKSYADATAEIEAFAASQQAATIYGDDETKRVLTTLVSLTGDYEASLAAVSTVQDFATGASVNLDSASRLVAQAVSGNVSALTRYLPAMRGMKAETFAALDVAKRQKIVTDALAGAFGGAARAVDPVTQKMANLKNTSGDLLEAFGDLIAQGRDLNEALGGLVMVLGAATKAIQDFAAIRDREARKTALGKMIDREAELSRNLREELERLARAGRLPEEAIRGVMLGTVEFDGALKGARSSLAALAAPMGVKSLSLGISSSADKARALLSALQGVSAEIGKLRAAGAEPLRPAAPGAPPAGGRRPAVQAAAKAAAKDAAKREEAARAHAARLVEIEFELIARQKELRDRQTEGFMPAEGQLGEEMGPPPPGLAERQQAIMDLNEVLAAGGEEWHRFNQTLSTFAAPAALSAMTSAIDSVAASLTTMAITGEAAFADLGASMIRIVAQLAGTLGQFYTLLGIASANPAMVAAGVGLTVLGGVGGAVAGALGSGGSSSSSRSSGGSVGAFAGAGETAAAGQGAGGGNVTLVLNTGQSLATRGEIARDVATLLHEGRRARSVPVGSQFRR